MSIFYGRNSDEPAGTSESNTAWNEDEGLLIFFYFYKVYLPSLVFVSSLAVCVINFIIGQYNKV